MGKRVAQRVRHHMVTGAPGTGKTTYGRRLSEELGLPLLSLDDIPADPGRTFPGTGEARRAVAALDTPHVVEGASLLGFGRRRLRGHDVILLEEPEGVLLERLVKRGIQITAGVELKGEADRGEILRHIRRFQWVVAEFKARQAARRGHEGNS